MRRRNQPRIPTITQLPSGRWHTNVMVDGKRISVTESNYDDCMTKAMELVLQRMQGKKPVIKRSRTVTLRDAIDSYIKDRSAVLSPSTLRGYGKIRDLRFQSVMDRNIKNIPNWQAVINLEAQTVSAKTLRNSWALVKSVLKENNMPIPNVRLPQIVSGEHDFLQPEEITRFLSAVKGEKYELVYLLGLHGLRSSEILGLDAEKNLTKDVIRIRGAKVQTETKKGSVRYVSKEENKTASSRRDVPVIIPRLYELRTELEKNGKLAKAIPINPEAARKRLHTICKNNGFPKIGLHGLRHSFASLCYHLGLSEMETMKLGGWSDPGVMRKIYTHLAEKDKLKAENKLKEFFKEGGH